MVICFNSAFSFPKFFLMLASFFSYESHLLHVSFLLYSPIETLFTPSLAQRFLCFVSNTLFFHMSFTLFLQKIFHSAPRFEYCDDYLRMCLILSVFLFFYPLFVYGIQCVYCFPRHWNSDTNTATHYTTLVFWRSAVTLRYSLLTTKILSPSIWTLKLDFYNLAN